MSTKQVKCLVQMPITKMDGEFANAFRLEPGASGEWYLDFFALVGDEEAKFICRLRILEPMLHTICDIFSDKLEESKWVGSYD